MTALRRAIFKNASRSPAVRYGIGVFVAGVALVVTLPMPTEQFAFYSFFLAGVAAAGILAGWQSALTCAAASALLCDFLVVRPRFGLWFPDRGELIRFAGFCGSALLICALSMLLEESETALSHAKASLDRFADERRFLEKNSAAFWSFEVDVVDHHVSWTEVENGMQVTRVQPLETWLNLVHPEDRERVRAALQEASSSGDFDTKFRFSPQSHVSSSRLVHGRASLVFKEGQAVLLRGVSVDLSAVPTPER